MNIGDIIINIDAKTIKRGNEELKLSKSAWDLHTLLIIKKRRDC